MKALLLGMVASFFFASTFVLNRAMELSGGSWIWSATLRYLFMLPLLLAIVAARGNLGGVVSALAARPLTWLVWSTVGFGLFYAPICFAAAFGPAWLVASTWQITIVAGSLLVPLLPQIVETEQGRRTIRAGIPRQSLLISGLILVGVALVQLEHASGVSLTQILVGVVPVVIAAFAYPLGNRKMMAVCGQTLDTFQRVLGMTIASLPFWLLLSLYGLGTAGFPAPSQILQSLVVALCSGVIATVLFFKATDLASGDLRQLAAVEATQAGEVLFAVLGEIVLLGGQIPAPAAVAGMAIVVVGMIVHSYVSHQPARDSVLIEERSAVP